MRTHNREQLLHSTEHDHIPYAIVLGPKKAFWQAPCEAINKEFACSISAVQTENKWKNLERAYKKKQRQKTTPLATHESHVAMKTAYIYLDQYDTNLKGTLKRFFEVLSTFRQQHPQIIRTRN